MKKRLMAVLLCVCMMAVLFTPYASVLTDRGALRVGVAGAEDSTPTETPTEQAEEQAEQVEATAVPEATATPEVTAVPEVTEVPAATEEPVEEPEVPAEEPEVESAEEEQALASYRWDADAGKVIRTYEGAQDELTLKAYEAMTACRAYAHPADDSSAMELQQGELLQVCDEINYKPENGRGKWLVFKTEDDKFLYVRSINAQEKTEPEEDLTPEEEEEQVFMVRLARAFELAASGENAAKVSASNFRFKVEKQTGYSDEATPSGFDGISGPIDDTTVPSMNTETDEYKFEYAYVGDDESNRVYDVVLYEGKVYYRTNAEYIGGVELKSGNYITLKYSHVFKAHKVTYMVGEKTITPVNGTIADEALHGTLTGASTAPSAWGKDFEFYYNFPKDGSVESVTITATIGETTTTLTGSTDGKYTISNSSLTGDVVIKITEKVKTNYTLNLTGSNTAYKTTDTGSWTAVNPNKDGAAVVLSASSTSYTFYLHGRHQWSTNGKALNKIAVTLPDNRLVNLTLPASNASATTKVDDIEFTVTASKAKTTYDNCSTPDYTVTVKNCYQNIDIDVNFQDTTSQEIWLVKRDGVKPVLVYWKKNKTKVWAGEGTDFLGKGDKNENFGSTITFYVCAEDGYELSSSSLKVYAADDTEKVDVTAQTSNGIELTQLTAPHTSGGVTYTHSFQINTSSWHGQSDKYRWTIELVGTKKEYTNQVKYDLDGGTGTLATQTVGDNFTVSDVTPTRQGYYFAGWEVTKKDGTKDTLYQNDTKAFADYLATSEGNVKTVTLKAKWTKEATEASQPYTIKVILHDNKGAIEKTLTITEYAHANETLYAFDNRLKSRLETEWPTVDMSKYVLEGSLSGTVGTLVEGEAEIVLNYYLQVTITYKAMTKNADGKITESTTGGTVDPASEAITIKSDTTTAAGSTATANSGYTFKGWYTDESCTTKSGEDTKLIPAMPKGGWQDVTYYALFEPNTTTVTVKKLVTGNFGDKTKEFEFHAYWYGDEKKPFNFSLKDGNTFDITEVPIGTELHIKETDNDLSGYVTTVTVVNGERSRVLTPDSTNNGYYVLVVQEGDVIVFTNQKDMTPDTGVILDSLPYVLILAVVALGAAGAVVRSRRRREDD